MNIELPKTLEKGRKRIGRGRGSGKGGHTVGRGQKGQKTRAKIGILFEGVKVKKSLLRRLPLQRGKDRFKSRGKAIVVNLEILNLFPDGTKIDKEVLVKAKVVDSGSADKYGIKILGKGNLLKKLKINLPISKSGGEKVKKAGGEVLV